MCLKCNNKASSGQKRDNKRSGVSKKGQQKVAGRNTKSIHDNPSTEDDIKLMRQLSEGKVPKKQIQTTKCRSVTCNRGGGETKREQRTTQVVQKTRRETIKVYSIRLYLYPYVAGLTSPDHQTGFGGRVGSWVESMRHCVLINGTRKSEVWVGVVVVRERNGSKPYERRKIVVCLQNTGLCHQFRHARCD